MTSPTDRAGGNRAARRTKGRFARSARGVLETSLIPADASLRGHPFGRTIANAIADLLAGGAITCICCRQVSTGASAFLAAINPRRPTIAAISAICGPCWRDRSFEDHESAAERVLKTVLPTGRFLDLHRSPGA